MIAHFNYYRYRTAIFISAVCLTLYFVLYLLGLQIEKTYQTFVSQLEKDLHVTIVEQHYHRGIFKSDAQLYINSPVIEHPLFIKNTIYHGPIDYDSEDKFSSYWGLANSSSRIFLKDKMIIEAKSNISFDKKISSKISFPAYANHQNQNSKAVPVAQLVYDKQNRKLNGVFQFEKLDYYNSHGDFSIVRPHLKFNLFYSPDQFPTGELIVNSDNIELHLQQETLHVDSLMWTFRNTLEDNLMNIDERLEISSLSIGENTLGTVVFDLNINGLNSDLLKLQNQLTTNWFELLLKALTEQTTLSLNPLSLENSEGTFLAHSLLQIKAPYSGNKKEFLNNIIFDADISMPKAMLNNLLLAFDLTAEVVSQSFQKRGLLIEEGNDYKSLISFRHGYLTINGSRTKLSDMFYVY